MNTRYAVIATALLASTSVPAQDAALEQGRAQSQAFLAGNLAPIWDVMDTPMREALGSLADFEAFQASVEADLGTEAAILDETTETQGEYAIYTRIGEWTETDAAIQMQWVFSPEGTIGGFVIQPQPEAAQSAYLDYETEADLRLPFDGDWYVFWGGRDIADNYHAANAAQRFALDFVVHEDGVSHTGDPDDLAAYHCWGREILAPADGQVVGTVYDLPDQPIGSSDPQNPAGNHVILALAENEFAFLAHLQQGSVRVQLGDEVQQGDVLGLCGNSGNTSEPHLHFHLQTTPDLFNGEGLPAQFQSYTADGEPITDGEPLRGQTVSAAP